MQVARASSVAFHEGRSVPIIAFSGDPRRSAAAPAFDASATGTSSMTLSMGIDILDTGDAVATPPLAEGQLRRCGASFIAAASALKSDDDDDDDDGDAYDPKATTQLHNTRRMHRSGKPLRSSDLSKYRQLPTQHPSGDFPGLPAGHRFAHLPNADAEIPFSFVRNCAEAFDTRLRLWAELLLFVPFLLLFVFFVVADNNINSLHYNGLACTLPARLPIPPVDLTYGPTWGPTFDTTKASLVNASDWLERVVVPAYWRRTSALSSDDFRLVLGNQVPIGGLVLRVQRRRAVKPATSCGNESNQNASYCSVSVAKNSNRQVVGRAATLLEDTFGPLLFRQRFSIISHTIGEAGTYDWAGNTATVPFSISEAAALAAISSALRANTTTHFYGLQDPSIQSLSVVATTFNPALRFYARTEFLLESPSSGVVIPSTHFWPFFLFTTVDNEGYAAYTVVFFVVSLLMLSRWLYALGAAWMQRRLVHHMSSVWFFVEGANLMSLFVVFVIRFLWWRESNSALAWMTIGSSSTLDSAEALLGANDRMEYLAALYRLQNEVNAINTVLFFLMILKYTSLHPTLERVTSAMRRAQESIVGLLAVFVTSLLAFAIAGNALFGAELGDFRSIAWSFSSLIRMLLGDSDLQSMQDVNRILAGLFYWAFLIFGLFLTLNFIMAVIAEALHHDNEDGATFAYYVPLKQQYFLFMDGAASYLKRLKRALRTALLHQQQGEEASERRSGAVGGRHRPSTWLVYAGDVLRAMTLSVTLAHASSTFGGADSTGLGSTRFSDIVTAMDASGQRFLRRALRHAADGDTAEEDEDGRAHASLIEATQTICFRDFVGMMKSMKDRRQGEVLGSRRKHSAAVPADGSSSTLDKSLRDVLSSQRLKEQVENALGEEYIDVLYGFWEDVVDQRRRYSQRPDVRRRDELQRAVWMTATNTIDSILTAVVQPSHESATCALSYPVLEAAARSSADVIREINRTVEAVVGAGVEVQILSSAIAAVSACRGAAVPKDGGT